MDRDTYLNGRSIDQLLEMLENIIRHDHYCPFKCRCFSGWKYLYDKDEIVNRIVEMTKYENMSKVQEENSEDEG